MADETTTTSTEDIDYYKKLLNNVNTTLADSAASDPVSDQQFAQYLDMYKKIGQEGRASSQKASNNLAGGYDNTFANKVGQQIYDEYLKGANDQMVSNAINSKTMALTQDELANNLAAAQYARDLAAAQVGESYGDMSMYGDLYGDDFSNSIQDMWNKMNPALSGYGAVSSDGGSGGYYYTGTDTGNNNSSTIPKGAAASQVAYMRSTGALTNAEAKQALRTIYG